MSDRTRETLELAGQHRLSVERTPAGDELRLTTAAGAVPILIEVTSDGIKLRLDAPSIALDASGDLSITADRISLVGRREVAIASPRGTVAMKASDDVKLSGERVMVNCDETVDRYFRRPPRG